ncbi:MAG: sigma-54-dependent Fis family transcriptional regulator [Kofleriaceae bacterium]|nr:sigma-54-dependent Fis family transcriptional regulator [Myxococcales bacterium]MCB9563794.1 sigma-54-dependent Fis family transcriptional regulator [Kofleriaceae bacterium]MCB9572642.1 sigma-54-dependent Fis family transcriptional regulator [Kofleriaceae bacterium]
MPHKPWTGRSEAHREILERIGRLARRDIEILILGPSGVGKEMYARTVHAESRRAARPFVALNCGAMPGELLENELFGHVAGAFTGARPCAPGLVEEAKGGTLFFDEIDALSLRNQVKLLRFLQEREYRRLGDTRVRTADVRIVAASNADLIAATQAGTFREDLLFRIRVAPIEIPPLRERPADIDAIFEAYRGWYAAEYQLPPIVVSDAARGALAAHDWPGNVRELENCVRYLTCLELGRAVEPADLPFGHGSGHGASASAGRATAAPVVNFDDAKAAVVQEFEREAIVGALDAAAGNIAQAARSVGKPRRTFFELMRKHGVTAPRH